MELKPKLGTRKMASVTKMRIARVREHEFICAEPTQKVECSGMYYNPTAGKVERGVSLWLAGQSV